MEGGGRSRRAARPVSKAAAALAKLAELKRGGVKASALYECKEEEAVYDLVEEDEYADIVAKRRDEGGVCCCQCRSHGNLASAHSCFHGTWLVSQCLMMAQVNWAQSIQALRC